MITVAICTYNRESMALQAAANAKEQLPPGGEILIVDQSRPPSGKLAALAGPDSPIRYIHVDIPSLTNARNVAAGMSLREHILYLDDDALLKPGALAAHLTEISKPGIAGTSGPIYDFGKIPDVAPDAPIGRITISGKHIQNREGSRYTLVDTLFGGNMALKVEALKKAGGFETGFTGLATWEETCLSFRLHRLGYQLTFNPAAPVDHYPQADGNRASSRSRGRGMNYYSNYVRNGTCAFLRGRPLWQQAPFIVRHLGLCEWRGLTRFGIPGLGTFAFLRGYFAGWRLFLSRGRYPKFVALTGST